MVTLKNPPSLVPDVINSMPNSDNSYPQNPVPTGSFATLENRIRYLEVFFFFQIKYIVDVDMSPDKTNICN